MTAPHMPEHEKLQQVKDRSKAAGDFYMWLKDRGLFLARERTLDDIKDDPDTPIWIMDVTPLEELLAQWLEIDRAALAREKVELLTWVRETSAAFRRASGQ